MRTELPEHVQHNIRRVAELRAHVAAEASAHEHKLHALADALGRPLTFYILLGIALAWIGMNVYAVVDGKTPIDEPPFFWLQGALALYAALVTTLLLVRQAGQTRDADRRAHIEFQINLLAEQKATKLIALIEELRRDLPMVRDRADSEADAMQTSVDPHLVDSALPK